MVNITFKPEEKTFKVQKLDVSKYWKMYQKKKKKMNFK